MQEHLHGKKLMHPNLQLISKIASLNYSPTVDVSDTLNVIQLTTNIDNQPFLIKHISNLIAYTKSLDSPLKLNGYLEKLEAINEEYPHAVVIIDNSLPFSRICALTANSFIAKLAIERIKECQKENSVSLVDIDKIRQSVSTNCDCDLSKQMYSKAVITGIHKAETLIKASSSNVVFAQSFEPCHVLDALRNRDCDTSIEQQAIKKAMTGSKSLKVLLLSAFDLNPVFSLLLCSSEVAERVINRCIETKVALDQELTC